MYIVEGTKILCPYFESNFFLKIGYIFKSSSKDQVFSLFIFKFQLILKIYGGQFPFYLIARSQVTTDRLTIDVF